MKAKLIKMVEGYTLSLTGNIDDLYGISNQQLAEDHQLYKLSLKNCEAIANGYDLDELGRDLWKKSLNYHLQHELDYTFGVVDGFQKALEILGDKKFSINDMEKLMFATLEFTDTQEEGETYPFFKSFIQSLQQTEWDVWVVMSCGLPDGCTEPEKECSCDIIPALDEDGCLILTKNII